MAVDWVGHGAAGLRRHKTESRSKLFNIVTSICVDTDSSQQRIKYPNLEVKDSAERRAQYWRFVVTFCCSSLRSNPEARHLVYTNDSERVVINGLDIKRFLEDLGAEIHYLPFENYVPPESSGTKFRNAYYKLDVLKALSGLSHSDSSVLVDCDCLWIRNNPALEADAQSGELILYDIYQRTDPYDREPKDMSRADMGELYRELDESYPEKFPIWYGGEFVGGRHATLDTMTKQLDVDFAMMVSESKKKQYVFRNGWNIFDGDEFQLSFVCNRGLFPIKEMSSYIRRIWSQEYLNNSRKEDLDLTIWHLPGEKERGLPLVFEEVIDRESDFWKVPMQELAEYLGGYVGIPERRKGPPLPFKRRLYLLLKFLKGKARHFYVKTRSWLWPY